MPFNSDSRILITGGTGSFGKAFIAEVLQRFPDIKRLVIYSRDKLKQWELQQIFSAKQFPQLRFFLGDVRDRDRLRRALEDIDTVVHAAALSRFQLLNIIRWNSLKQMCWVLRTLFSLLRRQCSQSCGAEY